jgi:hypothetical protein
MSKWSQLARAVSIEHNELGWACVTMDGKRVLDDSALDRMEDFGAPKTAVQGRSLTPKDVRDFFWENRLSQRTFEKEPLIWSFYDQANERTLIGLGYIPQEGEQWASPSSPSVDSPSVDSPSPAPSTASSRSERTSASISATASATSPG